MVKSSDIYCDIDLDAPGRAYGSYFVPYSGDARPFGFRGPIGVVNGAPGPTLTLIGGVHGDEYQGPIVAARLFHELDPARLRGRVILLPALNAPAFEAAARCSPLDGGNMNRSFAIPPLETPTGAIAGWLEETILPISGAVIDFHAGGKASTYAPVAMINLGPDGYSESNRALAEAFGAPLIWELGALNSSTSVNAAASRVGVTMMACELGGAGGSDRETNAIAHRGVLGALAHLGMLDPAPGAAPASPDFIYADLPDRRRVIRAPTGGVFDPMIEPGETVAAGDVLGVVRDALDLGRPPVTVCAADDGVLVMRAWRGVVTMGDTLGTVLRTRASAATPAP